MNHLIPHIITLLCTVIVSIFLIKYRNKSRCLSNDISLLKCVIKDRETSISSLFESIENISEERSMYKNRTIKLEDSIERTYGAPVRMEVTKVIAKFNKLEMVIILSGIHKLLKTSENIDDTKFYVALIERVQSFIDEMKEEE